MSDLGDGAAAMAVVVALGTYVHTAVRQRALGRADLMHQFSSEFSQDAQLMDLFTDLDYERFRFVPDPRTWLGHDPEQRLVRMLDLFNSVGHNCHRHVLNVQDVHGTTLGYAILRAHQDPGVLEYLAYVDQFDADHLGTGAAFEYFRRLGARLAKRSARARARRARQLQHPHLRPGTVPPALPPDREAELMERAARLQPLLPDAQTDVGDEPQNVSDADPDRPTT